MELKQIGNRIRDARRRLDITQEELAHRLDKSQNIISDYENGRRAIRILELPNLADALQVPIAYFFGDEHPDDEALAILAQLTPDSRAEILELARFKLEREKKALSSA